MEQRPPVGPAEFVRLLLTARERAPLAKPLHRRRVPGGAPRMRWIAEAVKRDALGWLARSGGWRVRQVVVGGRRREGRVWDPAIFPRLDVRFTAGPLRLLVAAMESEGPLPLLPPRVCDAVTAGIAGDAPATGDLLALHRLVGCLTTAARRATLPTPDEAPQGPRCPACGRPLASRREARAGDATCACGQALTPADLDGCGGAPRSEAQLAEELETLSPLTLAFQPQLAGRLEAGQEDEARAAEAIAARLAPLFLGDRAALLSYLDDALAAAWLQEERRRRTQPPQEAQEDYLAAARGLRGYALAARRHPDALRPLLAFFEGYVVEAFGGRAEVSDALREKAQGLHRASEREALLRAAGELFALGRVVTDAVEAALAESYVDRTERQKVLLADYHQRFRDIAPEVEAIRRELQGEVG